ncbi:hypothetical protein OGATHE_000454 [Ogataea polymorpha]|uniref:Uncharacterized protein n=1 Tax=Ogataea polymorpha TaxID=460523 RepID=A0A9P8PUD8_9ASCO|nr:hypothetical protein OGATHE_000454 [Ogataea polymorpha]
MDPAPAPALFQFISIDDRNRVRAPGRSGNSNETILSPGTCTLPPTRYLPWLLAISLSVKSCALNPACSRSFITLPSSLFLSITENDVKILARPVSFESAEILYENSVTFLGSIMWFSRANVPGLSGICTVRNTSLPSPSTALSLTNLSLSKFMFAPDKIGTYVLVEWSISGCSSMYLLRPATVMAPDGSINDLVSSNTSLIAAQISSVVTRTTSSTPNSCNTANVSSPTIRTAVPSANPPTESSVTLSPFSKERFNASASNVSTPIIFTCGASRFRYAVMPESSPPPPTATNTALSLLLFTWRSSSMAMVPWPAMTYGWSKGGIFVSPCSMVSLSHSALAESKSLPKSTTREPSLLTFLNLMDGVATGITIVAGMPISLAEYATPCAWLPAEHAITPLDLRSSDKWAIMLYAPLSLNEKTGNRSSRFSITVELVFCDSETALEIGDSSMTSYTRDVRIILT